MTGSTAAATASRLTPICLPVSLSSALDRLGGPTASTAAGIPSNSAARTDASGGGGSGSDGGSDGVARAVAARPYTLILIDGTWAQARRIVNSNPRLLQACQLGLGSQPVPRVMLVHIASRLDAGSEFGFRKEPRRGYACFHQWPRS
jgi:hypothetical protein